MSRSIHHRSTQRARLALVLAMSVSACASEDEFGADAGGAPPADASVFDVVEAADASPDAQAGSDASMLASLVGSWRAGPCDDAAPCVVAGFDPMVDIGPGVENCLADGAGGLIAIGRFHRINGVSARKIARWNGQRWTPLGEGLERFGEAIAVYGGRVHASGAFRREGTAGTALSYVGQFDGEAWQPLGAGFEGAGASEGHGRALTVWNGKLVAGGHFARAGGKPAAHVALWDGQQWHALGAGTNGPVHAFAVHQGHLVVAGKFSRAGAVDAANIAAWDGVQWRAFGAGLNDQAFALAVHANELYVTGDFTQAGDRDARHVARWDGGAWHPLTSGLSGPDKPFGRALASFGNHLIVGGNFTEAGGVSARRIAAWDGQRFTAVGNGVGNWVEGLTVYGDRLVACGWFNQLPEGGPLGFGVFAP